MSETAPAAQAMLNRVGELMADRRLSPGARAIGGYVLCRLSNGAGELSLKEICDELGLDRRTVRSGCRRGEALGYFVIQRRIGRRNLFCLSEAISVAERSAA
jgi:DNA-binding transcriptional regulator PaaX